MSSDDATWRLGHIDGDDRGSIQREWQGGWETSVPEPFWFRRWFRWVPGCYGCSMREGRKVMFCDRDEFGAHWLQHHQDEAA